MDEPWAALRRTALLSPVVKDSPPHAMVVGLAPTRIQITLCAWAARTARGERISDSSPPGQAFENHHVAAASAADAAGGMASP